MQTSVQRGVVSLIVLTSAILSIIGCNPLQNATDSPSRSPAQGSSTNGSQGGLSSSAAVGLDAVNGAWQVIHDNYVVKDKANSPNMTSAAIKGMLKALNDPYTRYFSSQTYQLTMQDTSGKYQGIGTSFAMRNGQHVITATMPDSPAAKAGIVAGDIILAVDGKPISEMSPEEAELRVRGPAGTRVRLLIIRQGKPEPEEISVIRGDITLPTVKFEMKGDIAYIRIYRFYQNTDQELNDILKNGMAGKGATGIVLDVRSNPGGLQSSVVKVTGHFINRGVVLYTVDNHGRKTSSSVNATGETTDLPMVVLSDNFSASASEVLMGALQDYGRATIAGTRTFGKGSVDQFFRLKDGSALYLTVGRWLTPNGRLIEGQGIQPDIELSLRGDNTTQWAIDYLHGKKN